MFLLWHQSLHFNKANEKAINFFLKNFESLLKIYIRKFYFIILTIKKLQLIFKNNNK